MENTYVSSDTKLLESGLFSDVAVKCGDKTWRLHKNILCSRSIWFEKALTGKFEESKTGVVEIHTFDPEAVDWVIRYIYTGTCDIPSLHPSTKTNFVTCYQVYTVADFFALDSLTALALATLNAEFDARLPSLQLHYELSPEKPQVPYEPYEAPENWLDDFFDTVRLVYQDTPVSDTGTTPIRTAVTNFTHRARFFFLQNPAFNAFLDSPAAPAFALDMFRIMRGAGDFIAALPEPMCTLCRNKPGRGDKAYYTHLAPERLKLAAACSTCAVKRGLEPCTGDWLRKRQE
ncbi:BTB/POZ protein [Podospora conica]|nr:BTB/POZ protein [Schizothecium conicum]